MLSKKKAKKVTKHRKLKNSKKLSNSNKFIAKVAMHKIFINDFAESQEIVNQSKSEITKLLNKILKNHPSFGVFTTIDRSPETKKIANTELVHGCHGTFGDGNYTPISAEEMTQHILDKAYSSAHNDSRKNQFTQPLKDDLNGDIKIALLKLPLYEINPETGKIPQLNNRVFKNNDLGIIMEKNNNKATYLPDVFPNKSWDQIRDHLVIKKAGQSLDKTVKFYAYQTFDIKSTIKEALELNLSNLKYSSKNIKSTSNKNIRKKSIIKNTRNTINNYKKYLFSNSCGIIIPHAGEKYAGDARKSAFNLINIRKFKKIIYLAALHNMDNTSNIYVLNYNTINKRIINNISNHFSNLNFVFNLDDAQKSEHSYKWVKDELDNYNFANDRYVFSPASGVNLNIFTNFLNKFMNTYNNTLLISTTDLIHYGDRFNFTSFPKPTQYHKIKNEDPLISSILSNNYPESKKILKLDPKLSCGSIAILSFISLAKKRNWIGKVVDYYDSYNIERFKEDDLLKYKIHNPDNFVSYVSIVYSKINAQKMNKHNHPSNNRLDIDDKLSKSYLLSYIENKYLNKFTNFNIKNNQNNENNKNNKNMLLPVWSFYNNKFSNKNINITVEIKIKNNIKTKILTSDISVNKNYKNNQSQKSKKGKKSKKSKKSKTSQKSKKSKKSQTSQTSQKSKKSIKLINLLKKHVDYCFKNIDPDNYKNIEIEYIKILNPN